VSLEEVTYPRVGCAVLHRDPIRMRIILPRTVVDKSAG
jgi:hypothetical protein